MAQLRISHGKPEGALRASRRSAIESPGPGPEWPGWRARVNVKEELHVAVEELTDQEASEVLTMVRRLRAVAAWDAAPPDDEEESEEERALVAEARAEVAASHTIPWSEIKRRLHEQRE